MAVLGCLAGLSLVIPSSIRGAQETEITFLDVGQGDAVMIRSPEGRTALIDAGPGPAIVGMLQRRGIERLDVVIASHPHDDHIGGMPQVLRSFPVGLFLDNGQIHDSETWREMRTVLARTGTPVETAAARTVTLGTTRLRILPPPTIEESENNLSVGVLLEYGSFRALFTGDSETAEIHHFLQLGIPAVTVLKAAHHGSRNGVTPQWVFTTRPPVVVIPVGAGNAYGHPAEWALRYYQRYAEHIFRTDAHGAVTVLGARDGSYRTVTTSGLQVSGTGTSRPPIPLERIALEIYFDPPGDDNARLNEEYVVIRNHGAAPVEIGGWTLCDAAAHCFVFPADATIDPGSAVTVHTGTGVQNGLHYFFGERQAVWNNAGDTATLRDRAGELIATETY